MQTTPSDGKVHLVIEKTSKNGTVTRYEGTTNPEKSETTIQWIRKVIKHANSRGTDQQR
jgi:hypothetical protein